MKQCCCIFLAVLLALSMQAKDVDLVKDYRARADGKTKVTVKLQRAIDDVSRSGGGRITLRGGVFLTGPIQIKDGVELHIAEGATLLASPKLSDYKDPALKHVDREALPRHRSSALIWADEARNISITGGGTIDGNGTYHIKKKTDPAWTGWEYERIAPARESLPRVVFFTGCTNVKVQDVTMTGQPAGWSYWIHDCDSVTFRSCRIFADVRYPNNDGIHINCSRDVDISGCEIETGDDSIVLRANSRSLKENKPCERVYVTDCTLRSWSSAVRIGWDNDGTIRDCHLSRLRIWDSSNGIGCYIPLFKYVSFSNDYGREATLVENITVSDVVMDEVYGNPVYFKVPENDPDVNVTGFRNIRFKNISARALCKPAVRNSDKDNIRFENCTFQQCLPELFPGDSRRHGYVLAAKPEYDVWESANPTALRRGMYNAYPEPVGLVDTPAPEGYKPVYISHYGRHGSRVYWAKTMVYATRDSLRAAFSRGTLTAIGNKVLASLEQLCPAADSLWNELTPLGEAEHRGIAERMVLRFPAVFKDGLRIDAVSSTRTRCIVCMGTATGTILSLRHGMKVSMKTGSKYLPVVRDDTTLAEAQKWYDPKLDSLLSTEVSWSTCLKRLWSDAPSDEAAAVSLVTLFWHAWAGAPCIDGNLGFDILDWLSEDELKVFSHRMDMNFPLKCLRTDKFGDTSVESQRKLLNDMITKADDALADGGTAASLRFGHDFNLVPLMGLMRAEGFDGTYSIRSAASTQWNSAAMIPMAANVQLVFYKGPGPVLVKILYNERETRISGIEHVTGPYYNWEALKRFWK